MSRTITIYSPPWSCVQCNATYRWLDSRGIEYTVMDSTDLENNLAIKVLGYLQAPVVFIDDEHTSGFNPIWLSEQLDPS